MANKLTKLGTLLRLLRLLLVLSLLFGFETQTRATAAKHLQLRPLSSLELRKVLRELHFQRQLPPPPQERSVSPAVAALSGFTLGLKKVLTGVFIYDVITANITEDSQAADSGATTQEICFNTKRRRRRRRRRRSARQMRATSTVTGTATGSGTATSTLTPTTPTTSTGSGDGQDSATCIVLLKNR